MPEPQRRLILANGEHYVNSVEKSFGFNTSEMPRPYSAARELVKSQVSNALTKFAALPVRKRYQDEVVLCLRFNAVRKFGMTTGATYCGEGS